jgi:hypothetical protein
MSQNGDDDDKEIKKHTPYPTRIWIEMRMMKKNKQDNIHTNENMSQLGDDN